MPYIPILSDTWSTKDRTKILHEAFVFQSEGFVSEMWITHDKP